MNASARFELWCRVSRWERAVNAALSPWRLGHTRFLLLDLTDRLVRQTGDAIMQRQLAEATGLGESAISTAVSALCDQGLLDRDVTGVGPPAYRIYLADAGHELLAVTRPIVESVAASLEPCGDCSSRIATREEGLDQRGTPE